MFLSNINRYYSDSYFKSGTYLAILGYFPVMIEWDEREDLTANIKRYSTFTVKAARLIPTESAAEDFLVDYMNDNPDDIFRYAEEFDDRKFALRVLEKATKLAPESAKRYYTSGNTVSDLLRTSKDPYVKKALDIYFKFGLRSRAYLLLDEIVKGKMSMEAADSIGNNADEMFGLQVGLCMKNDAPITYSSNKFIEMYSVETMRKINRDALVPGYTYEAFTQRTPEEMFQLLTYGFKESTAKTFVDFFEILHKKAKPVSISNIMIANMDKEKLKDFVIYCSKNKLLDQLLGLVDDSKKEYLLALTTYEKKEVLTPPVKSFNPENAVANGAAEDQSLKNIKQAMPPKQVTNNEDNESGYTDIKPKTAEERKAVPAADINASAQPTVKPPTSTSNSTSAEKTVISYPPASATAVYTPATAIKKEEPKAIVQPVSVTKAIPQPTLALVASKTAPIANVAETPKRDVVPVPIPEAIEPIKIILDERSKNIIELKKNILQTIQSIPAFINKDYAEEILMYAAQKEPDELFKKIEDFKGKFFCKKILEECAINAPVSLKRYLYNPHQPVNYILQYSQNAVVKKIFEINPALGYHSKPLLLLDDIVDGKISPTQAVAISNDPVLLFSSVVKIISRPKYISKYSINREMRDYSLRFIREINDKIATGAPQPFSSVEGFNSADLYFLMLYGRDEVFTSTFNGLFDRFIQKLPKDNGDAFLVSINNNQFRDFLSLCANYGTLEEFLTKFSPGAKQKLLQLYVARLEAEKDNLSTIVLVAEAISNLKDYSLLSVLQESIKKEYERVKASKDQIGISIYGVLSSMISGNATTEATWYKRISQQFKISPAATLASTTLFSQGPVCAEQMYFYDDDDGRSLIL